MNCSNSKHRIINDNDERYQLLFGPYHPPKIPRNRTLVCEMSGKLAVGDWSGGPIPWPMRLWTHSIILCGDLVRAVKYESVQAVCYHWDVCESVVLKWRQALGVEESNIGTQRLRKWAGRAAQAGKNARLAERARRPHGRISRRQRHRVHELKRPATSQVIRERMARTGRAPDPELKLWTPQEEKLLGTESDEVIARQLGRTVQAVRLRRTQLGIAAWNYKYPRIWTQEEDRLLGGKTDKELARILGCPCHVVLHRRRTLGIGSPFKHPWTPEADKLLGTGPDSEIARLLNRTVVAVRIRRRRLGVRNEHSSIVHWTAAELKLFGKQSDEQIARQTGRTLLAVAAKRRKLGLPVLYRKKRRPRAETSFRYAWEFPWTVEEDALLGKIDDRELERRLNRSAGAIKARRYQLGIRAFNGRPVNARSWSSDEERLLGTKPDSVLARMFGRTVKAVKNRRQLKRIRLVRKQWRPEDDRVLGTRPDEEIAQLLGRKTWQVTWRRKKLGIRNYYKVRRWAEHELALLGVKPDHEVARLTGHTVAAVAAKRVFLGKPKADAVKAYWTAREDKLLGTIPDAEVAKQIGRNTGAVKKRRLRLGIPNNSPQHRRWTKEEIALLGTMPDKALAERLHCGKKAVAYKRMSLKIPRLARL